jgi:citrate lyase subunit beta / citryl-CoA lyase
MTDTRPMPSGVRSYLFAPGNHPRKVEKVFTAGADAILLDLEDAVPPKEKIATRAVVIAAMRAPRRARGYVRVNGLDTEWCADDIAAVAGPWLDGLVLPKVESAEQVRQASAWIAAVERAAGLPIVETARGIELANEIAAADRRLARLAFGGGDYTNDLDLEWTSEERELDYARARLTHASRLANIEPPVDTVVIAVKDIERFRVSARNGRRMGLYGKLCIHPDQVAPCNEVFTPDAAQLAHARAVVEAFERAEASGSASIQVNGQFVDYPIVFKARRILAAAARAGG